MTSSDVETAALELIKDGRQPTVRDVRDRLGRGSPVTITPLLKKWWSRLNEEKLEASDYLSTNLIVVLRAEFRKAKAEATAVFGEEIAILKEDLATSLQALAETEVRLEEKSEKVAVLEHAYAKQGGEIEALKQEIRRLTYHLNQSLKAKEESAKRQSTQYGELTKALAAFNQHMCELKEDAVKTLPMSSAAIHS